MRKDRLVLGAFLALVLVMPALLPSFYVTLLNYIGLYAMVALGLVLLTGVGGLTSFGQAAFVGLGAYTTAALTTVSPATPRMVSPRRPFAATTQKSSSKTRSWMRSSSVGRATSKAA